MISRVSIKGFRGIREGVVEGLSQFTVLIGRNGSGKSSILEAVYLASAYVDGRDAVRREYKLNYLVRRRGARGEWARSRQVLWYSMDTGKPIEIELTIKGEPVRFLVKDTDNILSAVEEAPRDGAAKKARAEEVTGVLERTIFVDPQLLSRPSLIEEMTWAKVAARRLDKRIIEMVRKGLEPTAEGLTYIPIGPETVLALQTETTTVRVDDVGDGTRSAILLALLILGLNPSILLLEEPETHMHPAGLATLLDFLLTLSGEEGFQVIASTHSVDLVHIATSLARQHQVELSVVYLERARDGRLSSRPFTLDDVEALRELGVDLRLAHAF